MILHLHSDASYLSEPDGRSQMGRHFNIGLENDGKINKRLVAMLSPIIKHIMSSVSKAELVVLFYNSKATMPLRVILQKTEHVQPPMLVTTENSIAHGLATKYMTPKASTAMDMRFHYLKCNEAQRNFRYLWRRVHKNRAGFHTKRHLVRHYIEK